MQLVLHPVCNWPKLAWAARLEKRAEEIHVYHGPMVETARDWIAEAVWDGDFSSGNFDQSELVFGTGIRCRGNRLVFVSSGSTLDRLVYCCCNDVWYVSNSLPALLAISGLKLCDDHKYATQLRTICHGLSEYTRSLPAVPYDLRLIYFDNLVFDGERVVEEGKPDTYTDCRTYGEYLDYLHSTARGLGGNAVCDSRNHSVGQLASISSGYDSLASAIISRTSGCSQAVTIEHSTSLWRGSDSGEAFARQLGMECQAISRTSSCYPHEASIWAVVGRPGVMNWTKMGYTAPLCLFFSGCHGDKLWDRGEAPSGDPFRIPSIADLGIGEFRLLQGVFHCPVPFWGMRHLKEVRRLGLSREMEPWTMHTNYDRPIPRRIIEEAGIKRGTFAVRKKNTSTEARFLWPYSPDAQVSFAKFLERRGVKPLSPWMVRLTRHVAQLDQLVQRNVCEPLGMHRRERPWERMTGQSLLFQWANEVLQELYTSGFAIACADNSLSGLANLRPMSSCNSSAAAWSTK